MTLKYIIFSISVGFISWIVGMLVNAFLIKTKFYQKNLTCLNFIRSRKINRLIGIDLTRKIIKDSFIRFLNPLLKLNTKSNLDDLIRLRELMTKSEIDHLIGFVFVSIFAIVKFLKLDFWFGLTIMAANILMNLYPSLLQQLNKRRIDRLIGIIKKRDSSTDIL